MEDDKVIEIKDRGRCEICYQKIINEDNKIQCASCLQDFHYTCIDIALESSFKCPMCKEEVVSKTFSDPNEYDFDFQSELENLDDEFNIGDFMYTFSKFLIFVAVIIIILISLFFNFL